MRTIRILFASVGLLLYAATLAAAPAVPNSSARETLLVLGDSLSAAFGMEAQQSWVALLEQRLRTSGYGQWQVVNASVSGETTDGGLTRLPALLQQHRPAVVVIELGGNDGLRALPLDRIRDNLQRLVERARAGGARVVLVGMRIPPNYGPAYAQGFEGIYRDLARRLRVPLVPFLLEGVAGNGLLMQTDGVHAGPEAQPKLLDNVWPALKPLLHP